MWLIKPFFSSAWLIWSLFLIIFSIMLPFSGGIILDNTNNYGIVKTETVFGFAPNHGYLNNSLNSTEPIEWILTNGSFERRTFQVEQPKPQENPTNKDQTAKVEERTQKKQKKYRKSKSLKKSKRKGKSKKCIIKMYDEMGKKKGRKRNKNKMIKGKYMMSMILGLLAAKSILIPIALKALAFISAKGLIMGFFSTVMASLLSLKGMFENNYKNQDHKDDTKTQVEIIQVPTKSEDHIYYDEHHRRNEFALSEMIVPPNPGPDDWEAAYQATAPIRSRK